MIPIECAINIPDFRGDLSRFRSEQQSPSDDELSFVKDAMQEILTKFGVTDQCEVEVEDSLHSGKNINSMMHNYMAVHPQAFRRLLDDGWVATSLFYNSVTGMIYAIELESPDGEQTYQQIVETSPSQDCGWSNMESGFVF